MSAPPGDVKQELLDTLHLLFRYIHAPEQKLLDFALDAGVRLTGSDLGVLYRVSEDENRLSLRARVPGTADLQNPGQSLSRPGEDCVPWAGTSPFPCLTAAGW